MASLGGELDVVRVIVAPSEDDEVLQSPGDDEHAVAHRTEVAGSEPRLLAAGEACAERRRRLLRTAPIAARDARAGHPDLADAAGADRCRRIRVHDGHLVLLGGAARR